MSEIEKKLDEIEAETMANIRHLAETEKRLSAYLVEMQKAKNAERDILDVLP